MPVTPASRTPVEVVVKQTKLEASLGALKQDIAALGLEGKVRLISHESIIEPEIQLWCPRGSDAPAKLVELFEKAGFKRGSFENYGNRTSCWHDENNTRYVFQTDERGGAAVMRRPGGLS